MAKQKALERIELAILDDEREILDLFKEWLPKSKYAVHTYKTPEELFDDIEQGRDYHVMIIDRQVTPPNRRFVGGDFGGDEAIKRLRKIFPLKLIISMSGYHDPSPGANVCLGKPFSFQGLDAFIQEQITAHKTYHEPPREGD